MLLVNAFPARRAKDILVLLGLLFFVALYILFRMMRPEKLVDPDAFPTLVQYLTAMRSPVTPLFPSTWASDALGPLLKKGTTDVAFFLLMLWTSRSYEQLPWPAAQTTALARAILWLVLYKAVTVMWPG